MALPTSLVRFATQAVADDGRPLQWGRAAVDGLPFRGRLPLMPDAEYEARAVRTADFKCAFFDVATEEGRRDYQTLMDRCLNKWYQLITRELFQGGTTRHYVEWAEWYMEDGVRTPYVEYPGGGTVNGNGDG